MIIRLNKRQAGYAKIKRRVFEDTQKGIKVWTKHRYEILELGIDLKTGSLKLMFYDHPIPRANHNKTTDEIKRDKEFIKLIKNHQKKS